MTRIDGYEDRVFAVVDRYKNEVFDWSNSRCVEMGRDVVLAVRGDDAVVPEIPTLTDSNSVSEYMAANGFAGIGDALAVHFEECPVTSARLGDIGVISGALVVCIRLYWFGRTETGPIMIPLTAAERAFRV